MPRPRSRPRRPGRRLVLGLLGALPAVAALGACTPEDGARPDGGASNGSLTASACAEGATVPRPSESWKDDGDTGKVSADESVLARNSIAVSPDGAFVAAGASLGPKRQGASKTAGTTLWGTADGSVAARFDNELTGAIAWHPDGSMLAIGGAEHIELTTLEGEVLWTLTGHSPPREGHGNRGVQDLAFTADGSMLASLGADGTVRLWTDPGTGCAPSKILDVHALRPLALSISPDSTTVAVAGTDGPVELWDLAAAKRIRTVEGTEFSPREVIHAPDGTLLIGTGVPLEHTSSDPAHAMLYALSPEGELLEAPPVPGSAAGHLAVSPDGSRVAVNSSSTGAQVALWDRSTDQLEELPRVQGSLGAIAFSPGGSTLYCASPTLGVVAWDGTDWIPYALP